MIKQYHFLDIVKDITSKFKKIKKSDYLSKGQIQIIDQGKGQIAGYADDATLVKPELSPVIIFGDHTKVFKYEKDPLILGADGTKALKVDTKIANDLYIYYFLKTVSLPDAGYSRYYKYLKRIKIPIPVDRLGRPKIEDQTRVASLLSKVESLIAKRKKSIADLDELLKSTFLEMFGDPVRNEMGWDKKPFSKLASSRLGKMRDKKHITGAHLRPYLGNSNVLWFGFTLDNLLEMDFNKKERTIFSLEYGDLLVCEGGEIGRCAIWKNQLRECYFQKALHRVRVKESLKSEFLQYVLWFYAHYNGFRNVSNKATILHGKVKIFPDSLKLP